MPTRYADSMIPPLLIGAGPSFILIALSTYLPRWKAWVDTWPGALISGGTYLVLFIILYCAYGDNPTQIAAEQLRWETRLPSYLIPQSKAHTLRSDDEDPGSVLTRPRLGVDVDALEAGELDLPDRIFNYGGSSYTSLMSFRSKNELYPGNEGLRVKLGRRLREEGIQLGDDAKIWLFTVPSVWVSCGHGDFRLWLVYDQERKLEHVVLDIRKGYGEPRSYVVSVQTSKLTEDDTSQGDTHAWTIPRSSTRIRDQSLRLQLIDPFPSTPTSGGLFNIRVNILLYTPNSYLEIQSHMPEGKQPASLRLPKTGEVWAVLLQWPLAVVIDLVPSWVLRVDLGNLVSLGIDRVWDILWVLGNRIWMMARDGVRWVRRGQGGWYAS